MEPIKKINPYAFLAKLPPYLSFYSKRKRFTVHINSKSMLGANPVEQASGFLMGLRRAAEQNRPGELPIIRFYANLRNLLEPGRDSQLYLNSVYSSLEAMLKALLNRRRSALPEICPLFAEIFKKNRLSDLRLYDLPPQQNLLNAFNETYLVCKPDSMLAEILFSIAIIKEYRNVLANRYPDGHPDESRRNRDLLDAIFNIFKIGLGRELTNADLNGPITAFVNSPIARRIERLSKNYKQERFGLLLEFIVCDRLTPDMQSLMEMVCQWRNKVCHGASYEEDRKENLDASKATKRIDEHRNAVGALLTLLMVLAPALGFSQTMPKGERMKYAASFYTIDFCKSLGVKFLSFSESLGRGIAMIAIVVAAVYFAFFKIGENMSPRYSSTEERLATIDHLLDGDVEATLALRNRQFLAKANKEADGNRERNAPSDLRIVRKVVKKKGHLIGLDNATLLSTNGAVIFRGLEAGFDPYIRQQIKAIVPQIIEEAAGQPMRLGVQPGHWEMEAQLDTAIINRRYDVLAQMLRAELPDHISIEQVTPKKSSIHSYFYRID